MIGSKLVLSTKPNKRLRNYAFIDRRDTLPVGKELREYLRDALEVKKAYLFLEYKAGDTEEYSELKNMGYDLIFAQNNVSVEFVLQAMIDYRNYGQAVLVTGQTDVVPLIKYLLHHEKLKQLIISDKKSYAGWLQQQLVAPEMVTFISDLNAKLATNKAPLKIQV